jgi:hypothetical protein
VSKFNLITHLQPSIFFADTISCEEFHRHGIRPLQCVKAVLFTFIVIAARRQIAEYRNMLLIQYLRFNTSYGAQFFITQEYKFSSLSPTSGQNFVV